IRSRGDAHQRVAVLQPPDAAGDTAVDETNAPLVQQIGAGSIVGPPRVAAVDDHIALVEQLCELPDDLPCGVAGRHHHPDRAARGEPVDQFAEVANVAGWGDGIVTDDGVTFAAQALAHAAAHPAESDETELHAGNVPSVRVPTPAAAPA